MGEAGGGISANERSGVLVKSCRKVEKKPRWLNLLKTQEEMLDSGDARRGVLGRCKSGDELGFTPHSVTFSSHGCHIFTMQ